MSRTKRALIQPADFASTIVRVAGPSSLANAPMTNPRPRFCITCGNEITKHTYRQRMGKRFLYCSETCFRDCPMGVVDIELAFVGRADVRPNIREVLVRTARTYERMDDWAQALHVSVPYLYTMLTRYFTLTYEHPVTGETVERPMTPEEFRRKYVGHAVTAQTAPGDFDFARAAQA